MICGSTALFDAFDFDKNPPARLVFPDAADARIIEAVDRIRRTGVARATLVGTSGEIAQAAREAGVDANDFDVRDPEMCERFDEYAVEFAERRGIPLHTARCMASVPYFYAAMMLCSGDADAMVVGLDSSSHEALMALELTVGTDEEALTPSGLVVMEVPGWKGPQHNLVALADCAVNPEPNAEQLADIALTAADCVETLLGWHPRVAMLSHSTHGHPLEPRSENVCRAVDIARRRAPGLHVDGELQLDAALDAAAADEKLLHAGQVAGRANVLVFPDLNAADIATKMAHQVMEATLCGPLLQGFNKPVALLSRASRTRDIVGTSALASAYAQRAALTSARAFAPLDSEAPPSESGSRFDEGGYFN